MFLCCAPVETHGKHRFLVGPHAKHMENHWFLMPPSEKLSKTNGFLCRRMHSGSPGSVAVLWPPMAWHPMATYGSVSFVMLCEFATFVMPPVPWNHMASCGSVSFAMPPMVVQLCDATYALESYVHLWLCQF